MSEHLQSQKKQDAEQKKEGKTMKKTVKKCAAALRIDAATNSQETALAGALSSTMQKEL